MTLGSINQLSNKIQYFLTLHLEISFETGTALAGPPAGCN